MEDMSKKELREEFFKRIPKARKINPIFQSIFELMYEAHLKARPGTKLLNIYASHDFSGNREEVYREKFFNECEYESVDFWEDNFIHEGKPVAAKLTLPFPDGSFDVVVTTKIIMEHVSDPEKAMKEIYRVLKPGGEAFVIAAHIRRQHQKPYDYFRMTQYGLEYLAKAAGFTDFETKAADGFFCTIAAYAYFFQRSISMPKWLEKAFDWWTYHIVEPVLFSLHRFDNGYGKDFSSYFLLRARK